MGLPLPSGLSPSHLKKLRTSSQEPSALVEREMLQLMVNDIVDHHGRESYLGKRDGPSLVEFYCLEKEVEFEVEQIEQAEMMIQDEAQKMMEE